MPTRRRGGGPRWAAAALILAGVLGAGTLYQWAGARADRAAYPAVGQLVDVGGYRLHLYCVGQGEPAVIFLHGLGGNIYHWALLQPEAAQITRACAYDRAGYGWSEAGPAPRSPLQNARELHTLLVQAGLTGPVILAGHSYGTNLAQVYADQYPDQVRGLLLVDGGMAAAPARACGTVNCMPAIAQASTTLYLTLQPWLVRVGLMRWLGFPQPYGDNLRYLSADQQRALNAGFGQTHSADTNLAEWMEWDNAVGRAGEPGSLGAVPVRVLMADAPFPEWALGAEAEKWRAAEAAVWAGLTQLSADSRLSVVPQADHASLLFNPDQRPALLQAMTELVKLSRRP